MTAVLILFLSNSCAVVTSLATTNAFTGSCFCPAIASVNWFIGDAPTTLKLGGCICGTGVVDPPAACYPSNI